MYRCQYKGCKEIVPAGRSQLRVITETRPKEYENVVKKSKKGRKKGTTLYTSGFEIAKEVPVCPACYTLITGDQPAQYIPKATINESDKPRKSFNNRPKRKWVNPNQRKKKGPGPRKAQKEDKPRKAPVVEVINPMPVVKG